MNLLARQRIKEGLSPGIRGFCGNSNVIGIVNNDFTEDPSNILWACEVIDRHETEWIEKQGYELWSLRFRDSRCTLFTAGEVKSICKKCERSKGKLIRRCFGEYLALLFHPSAPSA